MGKQWKQWQTLFSWLQNHCRWWLQPWNEKTPAPWKKSYDQCRQHIKKQRRYFANKDLSSQSYGFSKVMYGCESSLSSIQSLIGVRLLATPWTAACQASLFITNSWSLLELWEMDHQESWAPKNWCFWTGVGEDSWVPWTAKRSNQSFLKEISLEYLLEGLMLKLQYFGHLMRRTDWLEKTLILGKIEGRSFALKVQEQAMKMKTEHKIWCNGSGHLQPLLDWGAESTLSPAFIPNCRLQDFFFNLIFPKTLHWHSPDLFVFTPGRSLLG